jgi:hypothetical protein
MKYTLLFAFVAILSSRPALAAGISGDLYCYEVPYSPPTYYDTEIKSCGTGSGKTTTQHVCSENVSCGYVSDDVKKAATGADGKPKSFASLTVEERTAYLKQSPDFEAFPTVLTCSSLPGSTLCPAPNDCAGDVLYSARPGNYAPDELTKINSQQFPGNIDPVGAPAKSGGAQ